MLANYAGQNIIPAMLHALVRNVSVLIGGHYPPGSTSRLPVKGHLPDYISPLPFVESIRVRRYLGDMCKVNMEQYRFVTIFLVISH